MTDRDRFLSVMKFDTNVMPPRWEFGYWAGTVRRWYNEGLPENKGLPPYLKDGDVIRAEAIPTYEMGPPFDAEVCAFLNFDKGLKKVNFEEGFFPELTEEVVDEADDNLVVIDSWGRKKMIKKDESSMPHFVSFPLKDESDLEFIKSKFNPNEKDRFPENWDHLVQEYKKRDYPLGIGHYPVGFYGILREFMGLTDFLVALKDSPVFIKKLIDFFLDYYIELYDKVLNQIDIDFARFHEDISYKSGSIISPKDFREFFLPPYRKLCSFLKDHNVNIILVDTDGNCEELIPLFIEAGVTGLMPFEVDSGINVVDIRKKFPKLQILGGLNKFTLTKGSEAIDDEIRAIVPEMLKAGGYIPHLDHLVQPNVSFDAFVYYRSQLDTYIR